MTTLILRGTVPSKKNNYRRAANGRMFLRDSDTSVINGLILQAREQWSGRDPIEHPSMEFTFLVRDRRADRDNKLVTCMDVLQKAGVLVNDNTRRCNGRIVIHPAVIDRDEAVFIRIAEGS